MQNLDQTALNKNIKLKLIEMSGKIKKKANGILKHDYLIPGGFYSQQWDWDAFFMGLALSSWIPSEAIYLKNISLNILEFADEDGFCPGCLTPEGPSKTLKHTKPFVAQGVFVASRKLGDFNWIKPYYEKLMKMVMYREKHYWHKEYDLGSWWDAMESGADNNLAILPFKENSIIAPDLNTFIYLEYKAFSYISSELGENEISQKFKQRAEEIKNNINKYLWCEEDQAYYTVDSTNGDFVKCISYSSVVPLWAKILEQDKAEKFINRYVLNPEKLWSEHGIRSLSKDYPGYNQENIIVPFSNWQGPVWPIANYLHCHGLLLYGYKDEALMVAQRIVKNCLDDIEKTGGMHENYNAETGEPLAAQDFVSWNMLLLNLIDELNSNTHPLKELL